MNNRLLNNFNNYYKQLKRKVTNEELQLDNYLDVVTKTMEVAEKTDLSGSEKKELVIYMLDQLNKDYLIDICDETAVKIMYTREMLTDVIDVIKFVAKGRTMLTKKNKWLTFCCSNK